MGQVINVLAGLATTFVGYIIGRTWQKVIDRMPYRRAKFFWQPLLKADTQIVVSRFISDSFPEPTGLVGGGDALALREISSYFSRIGLRRLSVVYVDEPTVDRNNNLILLGGPDANAVTRDALERIKPQLRLLDPGPGIRTEVHDLAPATSPDGSGAGLTEKRYIPEPDSDYGIIIRARNPFNPARGLVIFAGTYGYGTWGGVHLALEDEAFLERCRELEAMHEKTRPAGHLHLVKAFRKRRAGSRNRTRSREPMQLECIFKVGVYDRRPYAHEVIVLRKIQPSPPNPG